VRAWTISNNLGLLYNPNETASFFSRRWNVGSNPDLVNGQWFIVSYDSANKQKNHKSHGMQKANH